MPKIPRKPPSPSPRPFQTHFESVAKRRAVQELYCKVHGGLLQERDEAIALGHAIGIAIDLDPGLPLLMMEIICDLIEESIPRFIKKGPPEARQRVAPWSRPDPQKSAHTSPDRPP